MKREGGLADPLIYALIGECFGLVVYFIYSMLFQSFGVLTERNNPVSHFAAMGVGWVLLLILAPIFVVIGLFVGSAILHVCLMIVGGAKQGFETTFRVVCYAGGSVGPLLVVPFCGGVIAGVWRIVLNCIGLARAHETDTGRAVLAVFLPLIVCCGGLILLGILFPALLVWSHHQ
jgi:hypothetical protein